MAYSLTFASSEPVYVTLMQASLVVPGLPFDTWYMNALESLSVRLTLPAVKVLFGLEVVLENAEKAPSATTLPIAPTTSTDSRTLRVVFTYCS